MRTSHKLASAFAVVVLCCIAIAQFSPKTFTLAWDASPSPGIVSYHLYVTTNLSQPFKETAVVPGNQTTATTPVYQPSPLFFYVTCKNTNGLESDPSNMVEIPGPASKVGTVTVSLEDTNKPASTNLFIEAESGTLVAPMTFTANASARGGQVARSPTGDSGTASIGFTVAAGTYTVWCRVLCPDGGTDSFYVRLNSGAEEIYSAARDTNGVNVFSSNFQWTKLNGATVGPPRLITVPAGTHSLHFRAREANTLLDTICLTTNASFVPTN